MIKKKIGIIGCGNMGEAILGRLSNVLDDSAKLMACELDGKRRDYLRKIYKIIIEADNKVVVKKSDVIILAVKPGDVRPILEGDLRFGASGDKLLISIAAGVTTSYIEEIVGGDIHVIRAMPNMPALIGEGVSSLSRGSLASDEDMAVAKEIFSVIGDVVEVDEDLVDAVTATSGSGPAYVCYFIEALNEGAKSLGLKDEVAKILVLKTVLGTAKLLSATKETPGQVRERVTSKGGTTEAAVKVLESNRVKDIIKDALRAAQKKASELRRG